MKCKNCEQKEAIKYSKYSNGKFCSKECARAYSTKGKRKEINNKISKKLSGRKLTIERIKKTSGVLNGNYNSNITDEKRNKQKNKKIFLNGKSFCISCNVEIKHNDKKAYCKKCKKLIQLKTIFKKLNITETNLRIANQEALKILSKEYFTNKKSKPQIKEKYGILSNSIYSFFKKNGITLRSLSDSVKLSFSSGRACVSSSKKFKTGYHIAWFGKEYFYRSSYEKRMMEFLDNKKELYLYENIKIEYKHKGEVHTYITDFYLPERNLIIETKSNYFYKKELGKNKAKKKATLKEGYYYLLVMENDLKNFEEGTQSI